jgi:uncharacterized delta-60 repeat protein
MAAAATLLALSVLAPRPCAADPRDLDASFGTGGIVLTDFLGPDSDTAKAIATQPDGKIVVAGSHGGGAHENFAVVRYNADGSLDTGFGTNGTVSIDFSSQGLLRWDYAMAVAVQSKG